LSWVYSEPEKRHIDAQSPTFGREISVQSAVARTLSLFGGPDSADQTAGVCAAYLRVSSRSQGYDTQKASIERAARAQGLKIATWYQEKESARRLDRPELDRVRADARAGRISRLFVFRLDRLTRSGIRDTLALLNELKQAGCQVISIGDGFDIQGQFGEVIVAVIAWAAQMERLAIGERISASRQRLASEGRPWGRPLKHIPLVTLQAAERQLAEGVSLREAARKLKVDRSTLSRALKVRAALAQKPVQKTGGRGPVKAAPKPSDA
jgi:DNA invertase Pin-like site-specific DNA recombinase